jgi:hypothetical protein
MYNIIYTKMSCCKCKNKNKKCCSGDSTEKFLIFFNNEIKNIYPNLSVKEYDLIENNYVKIIQKLHKSRKKIKVFSFFGSIGIYFGVFLIMFTPYAMWILSIITLDHEDKASKHISALMGLFLMLYSAFYNWLGLSKKILIYDQTLMRLKKEGLKFLDKEHDDRYGNHKMDNDTDRILKFKSKIDSKIDLAILKFEDYGSIIKDEESIDDTTSSDSDKHYNSNSYNGYGGYFFKIKDVKCLSPTASKFTIYKDFAHELSQKKTLTTLAIEDYNGHNGAIHKRISTKKIDNDDIIIDLGEKID